MKTTFYTILLSLVECSLIVWACSGGPKGIGNLVSFMAAINLLSFFTLLLVWSDAKKDPEERPKWVLSMCNWIDAGNLCVLAVAGWWWTLAAYTAGVFAAVAYRARHSIPDKP